MSSSTSSGLVDENSPRMRTNMIILMLALAWFGVISAGKLQRSLTVNGWQPVPAVMLESYKAGGGGRSGYYPKVSYRYEVKGRTYVADTLDAGVWSHPSVDAIVARYPVGAAVTAYYNPADPAEAVLTREATPLGNLLLTLLGLGGAAALFRHRFLKKSGDDAPSPKRGRGRGRWR